MKTTIVRNEVKKEFEPFTINTTIETEAEAAMMWWIMASNDPAKDIRKGMGNVGHIPPRCMGRAYFSQDDFREIQRELSIRGMF